MRRITVDPPAPPTRRRARVKPRIGPAIRRHAAACLGFALLGLAGWQAHEEGFFDEGVDHAVDRFIQISAKLGFAVDEIIVEGRSETSPDDLRNALGLAHGTPIFAFDAAVAHERLKEIPWVRWAVIERRLPDVIQLQIVERKPIALWQKDGQFSLIDADGAAIPIEDIGRFNKLPVVVGEGAAPYAKALIDMLASEPDMAARVRWAVRVGERRWDLHLEDRVVVRLPEEGILEAWRRLVELERGHGLFARNYSIIDLRLKDRVIVRKVPNEDAGDPDQRNT
jgi:cell division protein FtsQ